MGIQEKIISCIAVETAGKVQNHFIRKSRYSTKGNYGI
jgi:hypothetical protein